MMQLKVAMKIVMEAATRDIRGQGCGIRTNTEERRDQVREAYARVWLYVYGTEMRASDRFNNL